MERCTKWPLLGTVIFLADFTNIYLNTVVRINEGYSELQEHLKAMDTRVAYLKTFEIDLSSALPNMSLWNMDSYIAQQKANPMPDNIYELLQFDEFRSWMVLYELVMRDAGLIGHKTPKIMGLS